MPGLRAEILTPFVNVPAGGTAAVAVAIQRRGFDGPIRVTIPNLPEGFRLAEGMFLGSGAQSPFTEGMGFRGARTILTITAPPDAPAQALELKVLAIAETPGGTIERYALGSGQLTPVRGDKQKPRPPSGLGCNCHGGREGFPRQPDRASSMVRIAQGFEYPLQYAVASKPNGD